jgi:hypothetical protein
MKKSKADFLRLQYADKIRALRQYKEHAVSLKTLLDKGRYEAAFDLSKAMAETGLHIQAIDTCLLAQTNWKKELGPSEAREMEILEVKSQEAVAVCLDLINTLSCDIKKTMKETEDDLKAFSSNRKKFQSLSESSGKARMLDIKT